MNDILLELGKNPGARKIIQSLGLPIPMPQALRRERDALDERPLADRRIAVWIPPDSEIAGEVAKTIIEAGANPVGNLGGEAAAAFREKGEAYGRPLTALDTDRDAKDRFEGIVFDGTTLRTPADLASLYAFFHPLMGRIERCGRLVVISRDRRGDPDAARAATAAALEGFVRSLAKEIGKRGATAQLIRVADGGAARLGGPLRFFLSDASVYVSGQPLSISGFARAGGSPIRFANALEGKVALVTGAARGIGEQTARRLTREGAKVVCLDRPADDGPASRLARELGGEPLLVDVTDDNAPETIAEFLKTRFGGVDIVVHNAGVTRDKTLKRMKPELWDMVVGVNLRAVHDINAALQNDVLCDGGRVICLSSIAGIAGNMGQTNYSASKAGIIGLVQALAPTLATRGITVNAIAPGFIETRLTAAIPVAIREVGRRLNNLGQGGRPADVAHAINFLASPGAQGVTGQVLRVCGGSMVGA